MSLGDAYPLHEVPFSEEEEALVFKKQKTGTVEERQEPKLSDLEKEKANLDYEHNYLTNKIETGAAHSQNVYDYLSWLETRTEQVQKELEELLVAQLLA